MSTRTNNTSRRLPLHTLRNRIRLRTPHEGAACPLAPTTITTLASPHASQPDTLATPQRGVACPRAPTTPHDTCLSTHFATGYTCVHLNVGAACLLAPTTHHDTCLSTASATGYACVHLTRGLHVYSHRQPSRHLRLHTLRNRMHLPTPHEGAACLLAPTTIMTPASPHTSQPDALAYASRGGCVSTRPNNTS